MDEIVEVRFIKDHQSVHSGNSFYRTGTRAHFYNRHAKVLVDRGAAEYTARGKVAPDPEPEPPMKSAYTPLSDMTVEQLRQVAASEGIKGYWNMKRETLLNRLEKEHGS